jgi:hypothetical protein
MFSVVPATRPAPQHLSDRFSHSWPLWHRRLCAGQTWFNGEQARHYQGNSWLRNGCVGTRVWICRFQCKSSVIQFLPTTHHFVGCMSSAYTDTWENQCHLQPSRQAQGHRQTSSGHKGILQGLYRICRRTQLCSQHIFSWPGRRQATQCESRRSRVLVSMANTVVYTLFEPWSTVTPTSASMRNLLLRLPLRLPLHLADLLHSMMVQ